MKQLVLVVLFLALFYHVKGQNSTGSDSDSSVGVLKPLRPSITGIVGIIAIMLSVTFLILAYAKYCHGDRTDQFGDDVQDLIRSRSRFSGVDETLIDLLPFFRFSSLQGSKEGLECSVCLSKFEDSEILRLLPMCKHAFHRNCIDQWLKSHSSCPLCRYKFDPNDIKSFTYSNSLRYLYNPSNLSDDPNLEIFVQREQDGTQDGSNHEKTADKGKNINELPIHQETNDLNKLKHKIIVSDVVVKNRWSDVNSADLLSLSSEMLSVMSSNRFSPVNSSNFYHVISMTENMEKIEEDRERKRLCESKIISTADAGSNLPSSSKFNKEEKSLRIISRYEKRSMSEIVNLPRFRELSGHIRSRASPRSNGKEERIRRIWLQIAKRTVQWLAGQERKVQEPHYQRHVSNV